MEINDNPPSEREWTIAEREEFFASQDARCGIAVDFSKVSHQPPIEWSTGAWNGPIMPLSSDDPFGDLKRFIRPPGIYVTSIVPPTRGWPIAMYCPICKETTFILSPWAAKPKDGDYFRMNEVCGSVEHGGQHNLRMTLKVDDHIIYKRLVK